MVSLKSKLSLSYALVMLTSILIISGFMNFFMDKHFREYVRQNQEQRNQDIVSQLRGQYRNNGGWDHDGIEAIGVRALENGLIIKVRNRSGDMIWDAAVHNNGMCQRIIEQMAHNVNTRYPYVDGAYTEIPYNIYNGLEKVGTVDIGSYGPYYLSDHDLTFIDTLNNLLLVTGVFSMALALFIGFLMAKRLSSPISRVISSARNIAGGDYSDRIMNASGTKEIHQLTETINHLAQTLEKQEALRKRLTGDVAHELRTPLATLQSHMEAMIDGIWEADTQRLKSCHDEIVRINKLVGDLEKLARYEGENLVIHEEGFDVAELVKRLVQNFEGEFLSKNITVSFSGESQHILADKDKISQVIVNLLSNAQKYTPAGGRVSVSVGSTEKNTIISVTDNGPGIPEEDQPFIFERFYRADKSRNRLTGGSGIGLAIAKAIVTAHKGQIEVKSKVGVGTQFIVSLPRPGKNR